MASRSSSTRRWQLLALWVIVAPLAILSGVFWFVRWRGAMADAALQHSWRKSLGGQTFLERYPAKENNQTVLALEALGCDLGIGMTTRENGRCHPRPEAAKRFQAVRGPLKKLLDPPEDQADDAFSASPPELARYLTEARPALDRATALLLASPPIWKRDLALGLDQENPNYLGVLYLERLLVAEARERIRTGRIDAAFEPLEAAWIYCQAVLETPNVMAQLIGQTMIKAQIPVLHGLPRAPAAWRSRLSSLPLREKMLVAFQADAFAIYQSSTFDRPPAETPIIGWQVLRWVMRDHARRLQKIIEELPRRDVRSFEPEAFDREMHSRLPKWQLVSKLLLTNFWEAWSKSAHLELAAELTALGMEERERLTAGAPRRISTQRPSRVQGLNWVYDDLPTGTRIRLDGRILHPGSQPLPMAIFLRRTSSPPPPTP